MSIFSGRRSCVLLGAVIGGLMFMASPAAWAQDGDVSSSESVLSDPPHGVECRIYKAHGYGMYYAGCFMSDGTVEPSPYFDSFYETEQWCHNNCGSYSF